MPPTLIDAMFQCIFLAPVTMGRFTAIQVPFSIDQAWIRPGPARRLRSAATCTAHVQRRSTEQDRRVGQDSSVVDCTLLSDAGEVIVYVRGLMLRTISPEAVRADTIHALYGKHLSLTETWIEKEIQAIPAADATTDTVGVMSGVQSCLLVDFSSTLVSSLKARLETTGVVVDAVESSIGGTSAISKLSESYNLVLYSGLDPCESRETEDDRESGPEAEYSAVRRCLTFLGDICSRSSSIVLITDGAHSQDQCSPYEAENRRTSKALMAILRSARVEYPSVHMTAIDVAGGATNGDCYGQQ